MKPHARVRALTPRTPCLRSMARLLGLYRGLGRTQRTHTVRDVVIFHAGTLRVPAVNKVPLGSGGARAARHTRAVRYVRVLVADGYSISPDVSTGSPVDSSGEPGAVTRRRDGLPVLQACPGCPRLSRVCRRPDVSTKDSSGELGAVTRRRDTPPLLRACPGCPSLSRVLRRPDVSFIGGGSELGAVTRGRDAIPHLRACPGYPSLRVCRRPDVSFIGGGSELGAVTRRRDFPPVLRAIHDATLVPIRSRVCRRPDVSTPGNGSKLGASSAA